MTYDEARRKVGARVRYTAPQTPETYSRDGVITSINGSFVFVHYDWQHPEAGGVATRPRDLVFIDNALALLGPRV
jgi:hypothetical protein